MGIIFLEDISFHTIVNDSLGVKSPELKEFINDITMLIKKPKINYFLIVGLFLVIVAAIFMRCTWHNP